MRARLPLVGLLAGLTAIIPAAEAYRPRAV